MKRVLLITYTYPPSPEVGALRPAGLGKYLPRRGWQPIVLTVRLPGVRPPWAPVVETEYEDVLQTWKKRLGLNQAKSLHEQFNLPQARKANAEPVHTKVIALMRYFLTFPDSTKGWLPFATQALTQIKASGSIDAILTTSPPASAHLIGRRAKQVLRCPWVADFRDLWSQNLAHRYDLLRLLERPLERRTLADADALVTVSTPWADRLKEAYPGKPVEAITNGFDADDFLSEPGPLTQRFTITYTGRLYEGKRNPAPLFEALRELIADGSINRESVRVRFYGPTESWLSVLIHSFGLDDVVETAGSVSRDEALRRQQESQVLLMLCWSDAREVGQHTGKLFEYLGSRRPILAVGGSAGVVAELLEQTRSGVHPQSKEELKNVLRTWHAEYQKMGRVRDKSEPRLIEPYTHQQMAARFADLLDRVAAPRSVSPVCIPERA